MDPEAFKHVDVGVDENGVLIYSKDGGRTARPVVSERTLKVTVTAEKIAAVWDSEEEVAIVPLWSPTDGDILTSVFADVHEAFDNIANSVVLTMEDESSTGYQATEIDLANVTSLDYGVSDLFNNGSKDLYAKFDGTKPLVLWISTSGYPDAPTTGNVDIYLSVS